MRRKLLFALSFCLISASAAPSYATTFVLQEAAIGTNFPGRPEVAVGVNANCIFPRGNSVRRVVQAAADYWASIYTLPYNITLTWGFASLSSNIGAQAGVVSLQQSGAGAGLINAAYLEINTNPSNCWYVDSVPTSFWEFPNGVVTSQAIPYWNQPGREVEVGRFTGVSTSGDPAHSDLYTSVIHEMGHLLGMSSGTWRYTNEVVDNDIDVVTWHVNAGLSWLSWSAHLTAWQNPNVLMWTGIPVGQRRWPSQADISCISQISGWWTTSWGDGGGGVTGLAANNPVNM